MQTDQMETRPESMRRGHYRRRGVVSLWTLLMVPVLLVMFAVVVEGVHLWLARVELENALEAAALAAVKEWAESGSGPASGWTYDARDVGRHYAAANTINQTPVDIATNFDDQAEPDNPNENLSCDVGLIFGAITEEDPYVFEADVVPSCGAEGTVFIDVWKEDSGVGPGAPEADKPRLFGVFFDEGPPELSINSVSFSMPDCTNPQAPAVQQARFDGSKTSLVSTYQDPDSLNRFNPGGDVRGLDPNDISFTFSDPIPEVDDGYRTFTANFQPGVFTSTNDPDTTDFVRFGASIFGLKEPCFDGPLDNDGDAFGQAGVFVTVVFYNSNTGETSTCTTRFVEHPTSKYSTATCRGPTALGFAVRARKKHEVPSLICSFLGIDFGPFDVSACTTAMYDCTLERPRLIRVEPNDFHCTDP